MKFKLTLVAGGQRDDVVLTTDATATVGAITERIRVSHPTAKMPAPALPLSLVVNPGTPHERVVPADMPIGESGVRSGDVVALSAEQRATGRSDAPVATLNLVAGPGAPATFPLRRGTNLVGRDRSADVRLSDPLVSKRHAKVNVSDMVQVIDDGSANGIMISGQIVDRAVLKPGGVATIGDTTFSVALHTSQTASAPAVGSTVEFNRSPRLDPQYVGVELKAPTPPQPPQPARFPIATLIAPLLMAGVLFAVTRNALSILFVAMSPVLMIGAYFENRISGKKLFEAASAQFRSALVDLSVQLQYAADQERAGRRSEHPSASEIEAAMQQLAPLTWTRRPEHDAFLEFRLGLGTQPSRNSVELPAANNTTPELWKELNDVVAQHAIVTRVPVVGDFRESGNIGVAGPAVIADAYFNNLVGQMVGLHSPAELVVAAIASSGARWEWLKWLPHVGSEFSPLECDHLASSAPEATVLVAALEDHIAARAAADSGGVDEQLPMPAFLVLVDDDAPIERARLVQVAERGPRCGVFVAWYSTSLERLPASCRTFVEADPSTGTARAGFVHGGRSVGDLEPETITQSSIESLARLLAPVVDSGVRADDQTDLPATVSFVSLAGSEIADDPSAVVELWRQNNALPLDASAPKAKRDNTLRALVGQAGAGPLHLDLRTQGPHALVGGTTGSGKSEFLQTWVLGMAAMHSPSRVTFLFVDYKGGAAFAECTELPHCVGLVTDLSPHLVQRALTSLNAELRHREHILNSKKAKDLLSLERSNDPDTPPSLVIVVDEFAALAKEVPEFVEGVIDVAQRGRSLGLHLVLATQRPAGVITDSLRANTNLRVALRMNDADDSTDVVGTAQAAGFDPSLPGRAVVRTGPGRLASFQAAYVGGWTTDEVKPPKIELRALRFGFGANWEFDEAVTPRRQQDEGPNDLVRSVTTIGAAARQAAVPAPRRPWLAELARTYKLEDLPSRRTDDELVFGASDHPESQSQPIVAYRPNEHGNMAVYGTGGTGKSAFLRSIAVAAAFAPARGGACHVYGLDFGSRGLSALESLPNVGSIIRGDDTERVTRLIRWLRETIDERAERYGNADSIDDYRAATGVADPRILLLVDGIGPFQSTYDFSAMGHIWDVFVGIASDGRPVGVHVVLSADRPGSVSSALNSAIQQRLVLRQANENDAAALDLPAGVLETSAPPGRGFLDGSEVQVAVIGGEANASSQAGAIDRLAAAMTRAGIQPASPIERLEELIEQSTLPTSVGGSPCLGVWDQTLRPIGFEFGGTFLITGPARSGRSTALMSIASALWLDEPGRRFFAFVGRKSSLGRLEWWQGSARSDSDAAPELVDTIRAASERWVEGEPGIVVCIEGLEDVPGSVTDQLGALTKELRKAGHMVVAEGDTDSFKSYNDLAQEMKGGGTGLVLQPDEYDGEALFKTPFPRLSRTDFPPGRGMYAHRGRAYRVQIPVPS